MPANVAIRLAVEGGAEVRRELEDAGRAGTTAFQGVAAAADAAGAATDRQTARFQRLAQAAREAEAQARAQANVNALLGVGTPSSGSARDSASVFEQNLARQDQIEGARRAQAAQGAQASLNQLLGVRDAQAGAARSSAAVFEEAYQREADALKRTADLRAAAVRNASSGWRDLSIAGSAALANVEASRRLGSIGMAPAANGNEREVSPEARSQALTNIGFQAKDFVEQVLAGSSPVRAAMMQAPTAAAIAGQAGLGAGDVVGGLKDKVVGLAEGAMAAVGRFGLLGGAIGTVATVAATGALALASYASQQKEVQLAVAGRGRASGASVGQINAIALGASGDAGVSVSTARDMASEFAATGRIGTQMYAGLIGVARDYAATTRQDVPEATKALAEAFADPEKGAETLNAQLGLLDAGLQESIQRMAASGDRLGAQRALFDALTGSVVKADERLGFFSRGWERFKAASSNEFDAVGRFIDRGLGGGDAESRLATLKGQLDFRVRNKGAAGGLFDSLLGFDEGQIRSDIAKVEAEIEAARKRGQTKSLDQRGLEVKRLVEGANPDAERLKQTEDSAKRIRDFLADGGIDKDGSARRSMEGFETSARRIREDLAAGGTELAASLRQATFEASQVGRSGVGRTTAEINEQFANRQREIEAKNLEPGARNEQLQSLEVERVTRLQTAQREATFTETQRSGLLNKAPEGLRQFYVDAAAQTGVPLDLLLGVSYAESRFRPNADANVNDPRSHAYGPMQLQPGTARELGVDMYDPRQNILGGARYLRARLDQANGDEALAYGLYHDGPASSGDSAAARKAFGEIQRFRNMPTTGQEVAGTDERARALDNENRLVEINSQFLGRNGEALDAATRKQQMLSEAIAKGTPITAEYLAEIDRATKGMASSARLLAGTRAGRDLDFDRDQLGRDRIDQGVYSRARSVYGDTSTPAVQAYIERARETATLSEARTTMSDAVTGFATDLRRGASAADALSNAFGRVADKLLSNVLDSAISGLFKAGTSGSGGGFLSSLFGGSKGADTGLPNLNFGYDSGGYTGPGGRYDPAGIVHRGEVVWSQDDIRRFGGVDRVETIRRGGRGYAEGGYVGNDYTIPSKGLARAANSNSGSGEAPIIINTTGQPAQSQKVQGPNGPRDAIVIGKTMAGAIMNDPDVRAALNKAYGMKRVGR